MTDKSNLVDQNGALIRRPEPLLHRLKTKAKEIAVSVLAVLALIAGVISNLDQIKAFIRSNRDNTPAVITSKNGSTQQLLSANAFKTGHALNQLQATFPSTQEFALWRNRAVAYLEGLGLDKSMLAEATSDGVVTRDEVVVLRDQIQAILGARYDARVAATFVFGADLEPATRAFEMYLTDVEFRRKLAASGVSILDFGLSLNANINAADFPSELKQDWTKVYFRTYVGHRYPEHLELIRKFRQRILDHFL